MRNRFRPPVAHPRTAAAILGVIWIAQSCPAAATSCDTTMIAAMSVEEAAKTILDTSDRIGFGFVRESASGPGIRQQEVDIVLPLKGQAGVVTLEPESINRVSKEDGFYRWLHYGPNELRLFALASMNGGAAVPKCLAATITSKPAPDLYKAIVAASKRQN